MNFENIYVMIPLSHQDSADLMGHESTLRLEEKRRK